MSNAGLQHRRGRWEGAYNPLSIPPSTPMHTGSEEMRVSASLSLDYNKKADGWTD